MLALICAIFSLFLTMVISVDGLIFLILLLMEKYNHAGLLIWPALAVSAWLAREVFYIVINFLCVNETQKEVLK